MGMVHDVVGGKVAMAEVMEVDVVMVIMVAMATAATLVVEPTPLVI